MDLSFDMKIVQKQKLTLTPKMKQKIEILQMSMYDLSEKIDAEFQENPVIEIDENYKKNDDFMKMSEKITDEYVSPFNFIEKKKSLSEYLYEQIYEENIEKTYRKICIYIIDSINSDGYLKTSLEEIAEKTKRSKDEVLHALKIVQNLEPFGIGARSIKECLIIQAEKLLICDENMRKIINNYLEDISKSKFKPISENLLISEKDVQRYSDMIKKLEPKPARGFYTGDETEFVIPDAKIKNLDGNLIIIMNDSLIPHLSINETYKSILNEKENNETKKYIKKNLNKAFFLMKAIDDRKTTVYKILECLLKKQRDFFKKGKKYIKPLNLVDVSDTIGMNESTVSRAIKDKYILTEFGTIRIKYLFAQGFNNKADLSKNSIKNRIKDIIDSEDIKKPFSDQKIADILKKENIKISRRAVTKYREQLLIKSSHERKRV
ncbi:RNA polymerase factor sigma-54 [Clostridium sp. BJN0001]|uniref:RNA polymerase factor sigma-54 n=1 Tax=Clostridium sp. BJN0001 TaxID=2930219 RepID=UPI001FD529E2|nr:RNA polymerase factor sigma-54 [Clostridium sp. BJN0001]